MLKVLLILPLVLLGVQCSDAPDSNKKIHVILDTDANNELDDQHAIAYLLLNGDHFYVEGLTVNRTNNGGDIDEQALEAQRVVHLCGLENVIEVTRGAEADFDDIRPSLSETEFDGAAAVNLIVEKARGASPDDKLVLLPVGKLTNIALALEKAPDIAPNVRIVWLGSNYPEPGEYNQVNDEPAVNAVLNTDVAFEIALVRYGKPSGTDAVRVTPDEIKTHVAGKGPEQSEPVKGRHGGEFYTFGDYSVNLFEHIDLHGDPPSRALFDMAAVAIVKNSAWAKADTIPAPILINGQWQDRPDNDRTIVLWEHFDKEQIIADFYQTMSSYSLVNHN